MSKALYHVGLTVSDMARSRQFYEDALGFRLDRELRFTADQLQPLMRLDPPSALHAVYLMLGDFTLELMQWEPSARAGVGQRAFLETGLTHLSIAVEDVPATLAKVAELGGEHFSALGRAAIVRDPDGQLIELVAREVYDETQRGRAERLPKT